jgi:hypothetical protein
MHGAPVGVTGAGGGGGGGCGFPGTRAVEPALFGTSVS